MARNLRGEALTRGQLDTLEKLIKAENEAWAKGGNPNSPHHADWVNADAKLLEYRTAIAH
jgi:hypothetical protein